MPALFLILLFPCPLLPEPQICPTILHTLCFSIYLSASNLLQPHLGCSNFYLIAAYALPLSSSLPSSTAACYNFSWSWPHLPLSFATSLCHRCFILLPPPPSHGYPPAASVSPSNCNDQFRVLIPIFSYTFYLQVLNELVSTPSALSCSTFTSSPHHSYICNHSNPPNDYSPFTLLLQPRLYSLLTLPCSATSARQFYSLLNSSSILSLLVIPSGIHLLVIP